MLGHSAGGHLALWVAAEVRDLAAVDRARAGRQPAPVAQRQRRRRPAWAAPPAEFPDRYAYADPARPTPVPRILIHGVDDDIVPIALSRGYAAPARLVEIPGADHFAVIDPQHLVWPLVLQEIQAFV